MRPRLQEIVVDCADPAALAQFWGDVSGDGHVVLADPEDNEFCFVIDNGGAWTASIRAALDAAPEPPA